MLVWLIYIAVLIVSAVFLVLYKDMLALILFIVIAVLPIVLLAVAVVTRIFTRVTAQIKDGVVNNGETAVLKITVKNRSPFPPGHIGVTIRCENSFMNSSSVCKAVVYAKSFSTEEFEFAISSEHIGMMEISVKRAVIRDFFNLFAFSQRLDCKATVSFIPPVVPVSVGLRPNSYAVGESDIFSKTKAGDDPSEVFDIRDYKGGDKLNRIHWKLTVKLNKYMVRDYSFPINESVMLYADLSAVGENAADKIDVLFSALISTAFELIDQKRHFSVGWYDDKRSCFRSERIENAEDVYFCLGEIFNSHIGEDLPEILASDHIKRSFLSHICIFSARSASDINRSVELFGEKKMLYSAVVTDKREELNELLSDSFLLYTVDDGVAKELIDFVL